MNFKKTLPLLISIMTLGALTPMMTACQSLETINKPIINVNEYSNGKIKFLANGKELDLDNLVANTVVKVEVTPNEGYELETLKVNNNDISKTKEFKIEAGRTYNVIVTFKKVDEPVKEYAKVILPTSEHGVVTLKNGKLDLNKIEIGTNVELIITPDDQYELNTLTVNGLDIKSTCSFIVKEAKEYIVECSFKLLDEPIKEFAQVRILNIENGTINVKNPGLNISKVPLNTKIELEVIANNGFELNTLTVNGLDIMASKSFMVTEVKEYTINATFIAIESPVEKFASVIISESINGIIEIQNKDLDLSKIKLGTKIDLIVKPSEGYKLESLTVNDKDILSTKSFIVEEELTYVIKATFIEDKPVQEIVSTIDLTISQNEGIAISPNTSNFNCENIAITNVSSSNLFGCSEVGARFSSGKNSGMLTLTFDKAYTFKKVELIGFAYNQDNPNVTLTFGNIVLTQEFKTKPVYELGENVSSNELIISSAKGNRFILKTIKLYTTDGGGEIDPEKPPVEPDVKEEGNVTIFKTGEGIVEVEKDKGYAGDDNKVTIIPNEGWYVANIYIQDKFITPNSSQVYPFKLIKGENRITVTFKEKSIGGSGKFDHLYANNNIKPSRGSQGDIDSYYESVRGLKGPALKEGLHNIIKGHTEFSYGSTINDYMRVMDADPDNPNNIIFIYEGSLSKSTTFNKEHTWAKHWGGFSTSKPAGSDLHNLRPSDTNLNSIRSNYSFKEIPDGKPASTARPSMEGNKVGGGHFEPKDTFKGDVARIIFYMATRYEGNGEPDLEVGSENGSISGIDGNKYYTFGSGSGVHGCFDDLYKWALSGIDPVADYEMSRNNIIDDKYQHNRNPFIDHPEFIQMIYDKSYDGPGALEDK